MSAQDVVVSIYRHSHHHRSVPQVCFDYVERSTAVRWTISAAVDLLYLTRVGTGLATNTRNEQIFDASLMRRRIECALLISLGEAYRFEFVGSVVLSDLRIARGNQMSFAHGATNRDGTKLVFDWFAALTSHTWIRRATEDLYLAITVERESLTFFYRAFEWLKTGLKCDWKSLGAAVDVPQSNINWLKKAANEDTVSARHAAESGIKSRIGDEHIGSWTVGTLHAITHARTKVDSNYADRVQKEGDPWPLEEED